jgi:hypothetical protein
MRVVALILRVLFGAAFTVFGANGVMMAFTGKGFLPMPEKPMPDAAVAWMKAMADSHFMLPLIGIVQLASGVMILTGIFAALGLAMLAPIVVGIVLYHQNVDPSGLPIAYTVLVLELFLAFAYGPAFRGVLAPMPKMRWSKPAS